MTSDKCGETKPACCPPAEVTPLAASTCPPPLLSAKSDQDSASSSKAAEGRSCCPPVAEPKSCCPPKEEHRIAGYKLEKFVSAWLDTPFGKVPVVKRHLDWSDHFGRLAMRWGIGRNHYTITPGLYALGKPDGDSDVLISANYKLSFDLLRRSVNGINVWILVIDTKGINVWCAAGKGTFGTEEIVRRVKMVNLQDLVNHRRLILPQLGAPGVAAHLVKKACGFSVVYGPVRAKDLPAFFADNRQATAAMRRVSFTLLERIILTPVEITLLYRKIFYLALLLFLLGSISSQGFSLATTWIRGGGAVFSGLAGLFAGAVLTPALLPWLPGRAFALKGIWPGLAVAILVGGNFFPTAGNLNHLALLLQISAISSYAAMNFTGSSTYTSPSGVEKEMRIAIPCQLAAALIACGCWLWSAF